MTTKPILGREVYLALAAVGWADGQLTEGAADAIVRTALEEGLELEDVAMIDEATKNPVDIGEIDRLKMTKADRLYVYAVASWITELDGKVTDRERNVLAKLGDTLALPEAPRKRADEIMREVAAHADRPDRFDLLTLRATLNARLEAAHVARLKELDAQESESDSS